MPNISKISIACSAITSMSLRPVIAANFPRTGTTWRRTPIVPSLPTTTGCTIGIPTGRGTIRMIVHPTGMLIIAPPDGMMWITADTVPEMDYSKCQSHSSWITTNLPISHPNCSSPAELRRGGGDTFNSLPGEPRFFTFPAHLLLSSTSSRFGQLWALDVATGITKSLVLVKKKYWYVEIGS